MRSDAGRGRQANSKGSKSNKQHARKQAGYVGGFVGSCPLLIVESFQERNELQGVLFTEV